VLLFRAVIRPHCAEQLCRRLLAEDWVRDLLAEEAEGSGRQAQAQAPDTERGPTRVDVLPRVVVSGVIEEAFRDDLIEAVCQICRQGRSGDGKIMLLSLAAEFRS